jgi:hypothetical protein
MSGTLLVARATGSTRRGCRPCRRARTPGIPADVRHVASARGETVVQIHGVGPFGIAYVNKADDPAARAAPPR